jgi:hypothetical protein
MNYNTDGFGNSLDTTKLSTDAEHNVLTVSIAFFCSGFGQGDRLVRLGHWRVAPGGYPPGRAACQLTDYKITQGRRGSQF